MKNIERADHPAAAPRSLRCRVESIVLVCKACEKRSKGSKRPSARKVAQSLRAAFRDAGVARPRIVLTSCLGACPKKAFTVAGVREGTAIAMLAFRRGDDAEAAVAALFPAYSNSTSSAPSPT